MGQNTSIYKKNFFLEGKSLNLFPFSIQNNFESISYKSNTSKKMFDLTQNIVWYCKNCGHTHIGVNSPACCPICNSNHSYEVKS